MRRLAASSDRVESVSCHSADCRAVPAAVDVSIFVGRGGVAEYHLMAHPTQHAGFAEQLDWLSRGYVGALRKLGVEPETCVFRRFSCSDLPNQAACLGGDSVAAPNHADGPCAVSWVCQAPALPAKVALWAYHVVDPRGMLDKLGQDRTLLLKRGDLAHVWNTGLTSTRNGSSYDQTRDILEEYGGRLCSLGMCLADNVIRTWFFVRDIDADYQGLVAARKEVFAEHGLTADTHFIASTGIQGSSRDSAAKVTMDAYAIAGVRRDQISFLSATEHLSPTHIYGVTFERGVSVAYRDRRHVLISGTASIDDAGKIVHPGNVLRQLDRTLDNVEALLQRAEASLADTCAFIVYVRDASDVDLARQVMRERFGEKPVQVVVAPVCRPGWLIEVECQAIVPASLEALPEF